MTESMEKEDLQKIADEVASRTAFLQKEVLTIHEAAWYMGVSLSYLYKLMMNAEIPFYKPMGKKAFFNRKELEAWLQRNRVKNYEDIEQEANKYCMREFGKRKKLGFKH